MQTYNSDNGGLQQQDERLLKNPAEQFNKETAPPGHRHAPRKSLSSGGFSAENKRRRSFKPKGEFRGPIRGMKRDHGKPFSGPSMAVSMKETSKFYNDGADMRPALNDYSAASSSKIDSYATHPMRQEDFNLRSQEELIPQYYGEPALDKGANPWVWNQNDRAVDPIAGPAPPVGYPPRGKMYDSPWESGIPGVQVGKEVPRPNDPVLRPKFGKKKFRVY